MQQILIFIQSLIPIRFALPVLFLLAASCSQSPNDGAEDFSDIEVPLERWEAYEFDTYTIDQKVSCFCTPPFSFTIRVENDEIVDLIVNDEDRVDWGLTPEQLKQAGLEKAFTINEVFELIEGARDADRLEVAYDSIYGFPTTVSIDRDFMLADEEIWIEMSNLRF